MSRSVTGADITIRIGNVEVPATLTSLEINAEPYPVDCDWDERVEMSGTFTGPVSGRFWEPNDTAHVCRICGELVPYRLDLASFERVCRRKECRAEASRR